MTQLLTIFIVFALSGCAPMDLSSRQVATRPASDKEDVIQLFWILDSVAGKDQNIIFSPASVGQALGLLQLGAEGETLAQMQKLLSAPADANALQSNEKDVEVSLANALWLSNEFRFRDTYVEAAAARYGATTERIDFRQPKAAATQINAWANDETKGLISSILSPEGIEPETIVVLTNSLFFDGKWKVPFTTGRLEPFLFGNGEEAPFYQMRQKMDAISVDLFGWRALRLPYRNSRYVLDVIIPSDRRVIETAPSLDQTAMLAEALEVGKERPTLVALPRFEISWESGLLPALKAIGLTLPFDKEKANLSRMVEPGQYPVAIDGIKQKAKLQIFNDGTKAAAVTSIEGVVVTSAKRNPIDLIEFIVDCPFAIVLRDLEADALLFVGRIATPEEYRQAEEGSD